MIAKGHRVFGCWPLGRRRKTTESPTHCLALVATMQSHKQGRRWDVDLCGQDAGKENAGAQRRPTWSHQTQTQVRTNSRDQGQEEKSRVQRNTGIHAKEKLEKGWLRKRHTAGDRESWTPGAHRCFRSSPQPVRSDLHLPFPDHTAHGNGPHPDGTDPKAQLLLRPCTSLLTVPCDALKGLEKGNRLGEEGRCGGAALG